MKIIKLTQGKIIYYVNCDQIHRIAKYGEITWINLGNEQLEFKVDQTPEEIVQLINEK